MKYIVYCTTNLINKKIYIGQHLTENPNKFDNYLGCGVYANRPSTYNKPKTAFQKGISVSEIISPYAMRLQTHTKILQQKQRKTILSTAE